MKYFIKYSKIGTAIFTVLLLFQSCIIYNFKTYTLDEAVASEKRTKIVSKSGKRFRYKKIIQIDSAYYGLKRKDSVLLIPSEIRKIKLKNNTASLITSLTGISVILFLVIGIATFETSTPDVTFQLPQ
ncbi:hypothetical protein KORDIASMS9_02123 [Kordia sp. SMS9]|uniref:hypothetical protein n=1 Tax=Kordia sp. SMS9 TaxID=2282170 RepID=UPI000E0CDC08|nr:hypothetical protein [Kordia sp. SMS9]AXG69895.1 hypothetical protein KORDIASMS9_02123 [Kordia sp. SMS9]